MATRSILLVALIGFSTYLEALIGIYISVFFSNELCNILSIEKMNGQFFSNELLLIEKPIILNFGSRNSSAILNISLALDR